MLKTSVTTLLTELRETVTTNAGKIQQQLRTMGQALTEMNHVRNDIWDTNGKELEELAFRLANYSKILAKVAAEVTRRDKYNSTIEHIMTILTKVQREDAQTRKEFNSKYAKYCVVPDMQAKLRKPQPVIYYETGRQDHMAKTQVLPDKGKFLAKLEKFLLSTHQVKKVKSLSSIKQDKPKAVKSDS